jgi:hypothetical protein
MWCRGVQTTRYVHYCTDRAPDTVFGYLWSVHNTPCYPGDPPEGLGRCPICVGLLDSEQLAGTGR